MTITIIILVLLILLSAFFSGSETGMMAIDRYKLEYRAKSGNRNAKRILSLLTRPDRLLGVILIGNTFANILASSLATLIAIHYLGETGIIISTILLTLIILIFAEVTPKTFAAIHANRFANLAAIPLQFLLWLLFPLVWLSNTIANSILKLFSVDVEGSESTPLSHAELRNLVNSTTGTISKKDKDMLLGIFDLKQVSVNDIMVPRNEINAIDLDDPIKEIIKQLQHVTHTRIPLFYGNLDKVVGFLHLRTIINLLKQENINHSNLLSATSKPYFIPEGVTLTHQLLEFQQQKQRMAFIVDEYGNVQGLVTIDDILEEVVGGFTTDINDLSEDIKKQTDGSYLVDGSTTLHELNRELDLEIPTTGPKTLNGLIIEQLESIPKTGISLKLLDYTIEICEVENNCVKTAQLKKSN